ncbi:MAG TPA: zinc-ribbon domain-containing protein, partial [Acidimicrobiales bacterium]|nr:zinc-ribbon domain-containing protein [Acidimicrobiales bacterium]
MAQRTGDGTGCPACAGLAVMPGRSFADRFPELAAEWHPSKNGGLRPDRVAPFTHTKAWWRCSQCGYEWLAPVASRSSGRGCSRCRPPGWSEVAVRIAAELGALLPLGDLHEGSRTVRAETGWEPDIVLRDERIAIDIDGRFWHGDDHHKSRQSTDRDTRKLAAFEGASWTLVRVREFPLQPIGPYDFVVADLRETRDVVIRIVERLEETLDIACPGIESYRASTDLLRSDAADALIARYQRGAIVGKSLAEVFPEIAVEWHATKNGALTPTVVMAGSGRYAWWQCATGHEWRSRILNRAHGTGCPYCSGNQAGQGNTLVDRNPALVREWHPTKNDPLTPAEVTPGTTRKVWWRCGHDHEWEASIASRVQGRGCPFCGNRRAYAHNSLAAVLPALAGEWHPTKNGELTPLDVTPGSSKKVWWLGSCRHEWDATIAGRKAGQGCPYCSGHRVGQGNTLADLRPEIAAEWHPTKNPDIAPSQVTTGSNRRVWWLCERSHEWRAAVTNRTAGSGCPYCAGRRAGQGNTLAEVFPNLAAQWHYGRNGSLTPATVTARSSKPAWWLCENGHEWSATVVSRASGTGCPRCSGRLPTSERSLLALRPELAAEWHPKKNGELGPEAVSPGSDRKVWWHCEQGHEWDAPVSSRTGGNGCPYCSGRRVGQGNSLADRHPGVAAQWHPTRNGDVTPSDMTPGVALRAWWRCESGHEWQASIGSRVAGTGCPYCSGRQAAKDRTLAVTHPEIAAQWHPTKNGSLVPDEVSSGSGRRAWWRCAAGHEWQS